MLPSLPVCLHCPRKIKARLIKNVVPLHYGSHMHYQHTKLGLGWKSVILSMLLPGWVGIENQGAAHRNPVLEEGWALGQGLLKMTGCMEILPSVWALRCISAEYEKLHSHLCCVCESGADVTVLSTEKLLQHCSYAIKGLKSSPHSRNGSKIAPNARFYLPSPACLFPNSKPVFWNKNNPKVRTLQVA